jgi:hypothetical protein
MSPETGLEIWSIVNLVVRVATVVVLAYIAVLVIKALKKYLRS